MVSKLVENKFIPFFSFVLGVAICTSTSLMSISYVVIAVLVLSLILFKPNFRSAFKATFQHKYVIGSVLFYMVFVCGILWSNAPIHDIFKMLIRIIGYLLAPLFLLAFQTNNSGPNNSGVLMLKGFIIGAVLSALLSTISYMFKYHILYGAQDDTWVAFHGHILHNAFLAVASCFLLLLTFNKQLNKKTRIYCFIAYLICFTNVLLVVNGRTGQLMLLIMNAFIFVYQFKLKGVLWLAGISVVVLPLLYFSPVVQKGIQEYHSDMSKYEQGNAQTSMGARVVFHKVSTALIMDHPLLGYGTGNFTPTYKQYITVRNIQENTTNPHSDLLWIGVETGLLGIMTYILMIIFAVMNSFKLTNFYRGISLSLILGYLLASLQNSFFIDNVTGMAFGFILLGLIAAGLKEKK